MNNLDHYNTPGIARAVCVGHSLLRSETP
jgi:hypothetical protein